MKSSRRLVIFIFLLVILFVGLLNWPFVLNEIIQPISLVVWLLLRVFVLSIDQQYYWWALILVADCIFLYRLLPHDQSENSSEEVWKSNETIPTIEHWRLLFVPGETNPASATDSWNGNSLIQLLSLYRTHCTRHLIFNSLMPCGGDNSHAGRYPCLFIYE